MQIMDVSGQTVDPQEFPIANPSIISPEMNENQMEH